MSATYPRFVPVACVFVVLASTVVGRADDLTPRPTMGEILRLDAEADEILAKDARIEVLGSGLDWSEGPVWIPREARQPDGGGYVIFSDVPQNRVHRWKEGDGLSVFMAPSGYTGLPGYTPAPGSNGLALDRQGRIVFCEHGDRRVSVLTPGAGKRTLADNYQGRRFNSPNDCTIDAAGAIYFTDPPYGLPEGPQDKKFRELDWCGVYRIAPDGVHVMRPDGKLIARIDPRMACGKCCFGGDDGSWLSICGDAFRVRIQTKTRGWP